MKQLEPQTNTKLIEIDFLFLDLETCTRCKGTDANLEAALTTVQSVLEAAGATVFLRKTLVDTEQLALELGFASSPTIRVNGKDIALELRESRCDSCADACGCNGEIDCRVWVWKGEEYTEAPAPMIVDAILSTLYGNDEDTSDVAADGPVPNVPENLKRFFAGKTAQQAATCCSSDELESCCEASEKSTCCGSTAPESAPADCGCR